MRPLLKHDCSDLFRVLQGLHGCHLGQQGRLLGLSLLLLGGLLLLDRLDHPLPGGAILQGKLGQDLADVVNLAEKWQSLWHSGRQHSFATFAKQRT